MTETDDDDSHARLKARIRCEYYAASGTDFLDCLVLGRRVDEIDGFRAHRSESWICRTEPTGDGGFEFIPEWSSETPFTGAWRSPTGACFVSGMELLFHPNPRALPRGSGWRIVNLPAPFVADGVWGLHEDDVYVWASRWEGAPGLFRWTGGDLRPMPAPPFPIHAFHGVTWDCLFAAGPSGAIARWDGHTWHEVHSPTGESLVDLCAVSREEIWAVGTGGHLLQGCVDDWSVVAQGPRFESIDSPIPLRAVAKWGQDIWVGLGDYGLWRRAGAALVSIKPEIRAISFDAREALLLCESRRVTETRNGTDFLSVAEDCLHDLRAHALLLEDL